MRIRHLMLAATVALPCGSARADDATRLGAAKELMAQIHMGDTMRSLLPIMARQMRTTMAQGGMLDGDADAFVTLFEQRAAAEMDRYTDEVAGAYARAFTEDELAEVLAFDRTPIGQKLIAATPQLSQAAMVAGHNLGTLVAKEVQQELQARRDAAGNAGKL